MKLEWNEMLIPPGSRPGLIICRASGASKQLLNLAFLAGFSFV